MKTSVNIGKIQSSGGSGANLQLYLTQRGIDSTDLWLSGHSLHNRAGVGQQG